MSIALELNMLRAAKSDIRNTLNTKGTNIPNYETLDTYSNYIAQISNDSITTPRVVMESSSSYKLYGFSQIPLNFLSSNSQVKTIEISIGVSVFQNYALSNCSNLESINIPNSTTQLRIYTLSNCPKLNNISLPAGLVNVGTGVFSGCTGLTNVTVATNYAGDLPLGSAENLTLTSLENIITNYKSQSGKTLTLHPTAYALADSNGLIDIAIAKGLTVAEA